jgi:hypothetical protein
LFYGEVVVVGLIVVVVVGFVVVVVVVIGGGVVVVIGGGVVVVVGTVDSHNPVFALHIDNSINRGLRLA